MSLEVRAQATREFRGEATHKHSYSWGTELRQERDAGRGGKQVKQCTQRYSVSVKRICPEHCMLVCATTACHSDLQPTLHILRALVDRPQGRRAPGGGVRGRDVSIMKIMCDKPQSGRF